MKFGREIARIADTPLAKDAQLQDALLPYKTLKKQIRHNGCIEPHVDSLGEADLPMPGDAPRDGATGGVSPQAVRLGV